MKRLKHFFRLALPILILVGLLTYFGVPALTAYLYIDSYVNRECGNRPEPLSERLGNPPELEAVVLTSPGGYLLDGWYMPGTNGAAVIVLGGGWGGSNTMYHEMDFIHAAGYSVLTYDSPSCAEPHQKTSLGYTEVQDLIMALDWISQKPEVDPARIGVFGHSMGGATAIMTAAQDERIKALVATGNYGDLGEDIRGSDQEGVISRWTRFWVIHFYQWQIGVDIDKVSPTRVIGQISPRAVFLMHGSREIEESQGMEQFEAAHEPKELWIVEGAGHGGYPQAAPEAYVSRTLAFFEKYLLS